MEGLGNTFFIYWIRGKLFIQRLGYLIAYITVLFMSPIIFVKLKSKFSVLTCFSATRSELINFWDDVYVGISAHFILYQRFVFQPFLAVSRLFPGSTIMVCILQIDFLEGTCTKITYICRYRVKNRYVFFLYTIYKVRNNHMLNLI